jgi:ABC-type branched-subunit amino acid transport system substrate-binding protein
MDTTPRAVESSRLSVISVALTAIAITINHWYVLGAGALALGAVLLVVPTALWAWFRRTYSKTALVGYLLMNLWIVVGFGLMKGLWQTALPLFLGTWLASLSTSFPSPAIGTVGFELSGLLTFVGSVFLLYYAHEMLRALYVSTDDRATTMRPRRQVVLATSTLLTLAGVIGAYVVGDRDRWVAPPDRIVKIGIIVPTTGPYAILGTSFVKAVQMAIDDLSGTTYRYQIVVKDTPADPAQAPAVVRQVIAEDKVNAIVGGVSLIGQVTKPYATTARIPHICVCTVRPIGDGAYNFTSIPSPEAEAALWVREAERRGIKRVAILSQNYPSINNHVKALKAEVAGTSLRISDEQQFEDSVTDFSSLIARAEATNPDVLYVEALNPTLDRLGQQLADAGVRHLSSVVAPSLSENQQLFEGTWYTDSNLREFAFKKRFEDKYPDTQFATHMMPYAYDAVNMIVQAFERGQNPAVYLRNLRAYDGTAGPLTKSAGSGHFESTPAVWTIRNGKPALVTQERVSNEVMP